VTGVLPLALEDATKIVQAFLHSGKEYVFLMVLHGEVPDDDLEQVLQEFTGEIHQKPPLRASVKRESRKRTIYYVDLLERDKNRVLLRVGCQAGTYIRKLCSDIGEVLGPGAHMQELRRTRSGPFTDTAGLHTLHELVDAHARFVEGDETPIRRLVRPMEEALEYIPKIRIRDSAVEAVCHGASLAVPGIVSVEDPFLKDSMVAIMTLKDEAVALAKSIMSTESMIQQEKGIAAKAMRVLMPRGTYPRMWHD
jgi:H/ACA ribonucleoprotein complex subunit 4